MPRAARLRQLAVRTFSLLVLALGCGFLLFLPFAGRFFLVQDELQRSDLILVLAGARVERWLEGVALYKEGWAPRLVMSPGLVDPIETQLHARGVRLPREGEFARDGAIALGIPAEAVTVLDNGVDNTAAEAAAVRATFPAARRVTVVTSPYHTRRARYAFRREFKGSSVEVIMRSTRYSPSNPARWWRRRGDVRYIMTEMPKYVAYLAGLGE